MGNAMILGYLKNLGFKKFMPIQFYLKKDLKKPL
jgi:hypothetical protein